MAIIQKIKQGTNEYNLNIQPISTPVEFYEPYKWGSFVTPFKQYFLYPDYLSLTSNNVIEIYDITQQSGTFRTYATSGDWVMGNINREDFLSTLIYNDLIYYNRLITFYDTSNFTGYIFFIPRTNFTFSTTRQDQYQFTLNNKKLLSNNLSLPSNFTLCQIPVFEIQYKLRIQQGPGVYTTENGPRFYLPDLPEYRSVTSEGITLNYKTFNDSRNFSYSHLISSFESSNNITNSFSTPNEYLSANWILNFPIIDSDYIYNTYNQMGSVLSTLNEAKGFIIYCIKVEMNNLTHESEYFAQPYEYLKSIIASQNGNNINTNKGLIEVSSNISQSSINFSPENIIQPIENKYYLNKSNNKIYQYKNEEMIESNLNDYLYFTQSEIDSIFNPTS